MINILYATDNEMKLEIVKGIFKNEDYQFYNIHTIKCSPEDILNTDGNTIEEKLENKAREISKQKLNQRDTVVLVDFETFEIETLNNWPGIEFNTFASTEKARTKEILDKVSNERNKSAILTTYLSAVFSDGSVKNINFIYDLLIMKEGSSDDLNDHLWDDSYEVYLSFNDVYRNRIFKEMKSFLSKKYITAINVQGVYHKMLTSLIKDNTPCTYDECFLDKDEFLEELYYEDISEDSRIDRFNWEIIVSSIFIESTDTVYNYNESDSDFDEMMTYEDAIEYGFRKYLDDMFGVCQKDIECFEVEQDVYDKIMMKIDKFLTPNRLTKYFNMILNSFYNC